MHETLDDENAVKKLKRLPVKAAIKVSFCKKNLLLCCVHDKDHMSALRIKNTSESDPHSYEVT